MSEHEEDILTPLNYWRGRLDKQLEGMDLRLIQLEMLTRTIHEDTRVRIENLHICLADRKFKNTFAPPARKRAPQRPPPAATPRPRRFPRTPRGAAAPPARRGARRSAVLRSLDTRRRRGEQLS